MPRAPTSTAGLPELPRGGQAVGKLSRHAGLMGLFSKLLGAYLASSWEVSNALGGMLQLFAVVDLLSTRLQLSARLANNI